MSLSFGPATATHNSGAGAPCLPQFPEGQGTAKGASHAPMEGSKYSVPRTPDESLRILFLQLVYLPVLRTWEARSRVEHVPVGDAEA